MQHSHLKKISLALCSAACLIAGSICLAASYLGPMIALAGTNWNRPDVVYDAHAGLVRPLFAFALVFLCLGVAGMIWSLQPVPDAPHNQPLQRTGDGERVQ